MKRTVAVGAVLLMFTALGGAAFAKTRAGQGPDKNATVKVADTDNVQQGDQTTPDAGTGLQTSQSDTGTQSAENGSETGTQENGSETGTQVENGSESSQETASSSDGPGGHADPAGNVDHQFEGNE
jgi:hypothetical protein